MGKFAKVCLEGSNEYVKIGICKHADTAMQVEDAINNLDRKITDYLVLITRSEMSIFESEEHSMLIDTVRDIERIGDHCENLIELVDYQIANKVKLTESTMDDLKEMFDITIAALTDAIAALDDKDTALATKVLKTERQIDKLERTLRKKHILRIHEAECTG